MHYRLSAGTDTVTRRTDVGKTNSAEALAAPEPVSDGSSSRNNSLARGLRVLRRASGLTKLSLFSI